MREFGKRRSLEPAGDESLGPKYFGISLDRNIGRTTSEHPAICRGNYTTLYAKDDVLIYERIDGRDVVLVAVNRGSGIDVTLKRSPGFSPGVHCGVIANASSANAGNYLLVTPQGYRIHLGALSSIVVRR